MSEGQLEQRWDCKMFEKRNHDGRISGSRGVIAWMKSFEGKCERPGEGNTFEREETNGQRIEEVDD